MTLPRPAAAEGARRASVARPISPIPINNGSTIGSDQKINAILPTTDSGWTNKAPLSPAVEASQ